ncbi:cell wall anchor protein [Flavobacterium sp. N1736]|uniref:cell wall anchor protein n=1 Tax=Flavobacterium sp. N1736 TaxID=2986823 RepID=UPI002224003D|nr:cell wall anchor protein [Flavobacterium sp. N1736]
MKKILLPLFIMCISINNIDAQTATSLSINDTRGINDLPNFASYSVRADFKQRNVIGVPGEGYWSTNLTFSPWVDHDNTGDKNHQLNFNNGGIFYRNAFPTDAQWGGWKQLLMTNENGNVGIGTSNPSSYEHGGNNKFLEISNPNTSIHSQSHIILSSGANIPGSSIGTITWALPNTTSNFKGAGFVAMRTEDNSTSSRPSVAMVFATRGAVGDFWSEQMQISGIGNVGIGTSNPKNKLDVNGTIHSKEVKVDMIGWSDFVFKKEYNLPTLAEVEKHINEKGHLENIPSEEEVFKNGINLGEMNAKLLQKIEELTLYVIDQNKNIQGLMEENKKQNEEIMALKKSILSK